MLSFDVGNANEKVKPNSKQPSKPSEAENLKKDFECKMSDDLHTSEILKGSLQDALKFINNELNGLKVRLFVMPSFSSLLPKQKIKSNAKFGMF